MGPATGKCFCICPPRLDGYRFEAFLERLGKAYADHRPVVVLDGTPSHAPKEIELPENVSLLSPSSYSPNRIPVEAWFQNFRRTLADRIFQTIGSLQGELTQMLEPYWREPTRLRSLSGYFLVDGSHRCVVTSICLPDITVAFTPNRHRRDLGAIGEEVRRRNKLELACVMDQLGLP